MDNYKHIFIWKRSPKNDKWIGITSNAEDIKDYIKDDWMCHLCMGCRADFKIINEDVNKFGLICPSCIEYDYTDIIFKGPIRQIYAESK